MPTATSTVGPLTLPIAAGATNAAIADPVIDGLLDFLGFWLETELNAKLAQHADFSDTACPSANRFAWNPMQPQGHRGKLPVPGLWMWQHGVTKNVEHTITQTKRIRQLRCLYLYHETPKLTGLTRRAGMGAAVDAIFAKASRWQRHPGYSYGSSPDGTPLYQSLDDVGHFAWLFMGSEEVRFGIDDGEPESPDPRNRRSGRDFPGVAAMFTTEELVDATGQMAVPADLNSGTPGTIYGSDGISSGTTEILQGIIGAPDGD